MPNSPDAVIRTWFEELWNQGKEETIDKLFAADGIAHGLSGPDGAAIRGRDAFRIFFKSFRSAFPDIQIEVAQTITDGDRVAALCHVTGTHRGHDLGITATGKNVQFSGMVLARVQGGVIVEGWNSFDFLSLYRQIGFLPL
jgi:steroid delta-isomerase-like uncharacterized protein